MIRKPENIKLRYARLKVMNLGITGLIARLSTGFSARHTEPKFVNLYQKLASHIAAHNRELANVAIVTKRLTTLRFDSLDFVPSRSFRLVTSFVEGRKVQQ